MQWYGTILPRIHAFIPAKNILEIGPGFGRWTQFLKEVCNELSIVDLSSKCIDACKKNFSSSSHISYYVNDGLSLSMIPDNTVDFAFSFDSLVHVDNTVMAQYIAQLSRKLVRNGVAFIHHSNLGEYSNQLRLHKIPKIQHVLKRLGVIEESFHWRDPSVTAAQIAHHARENGLRCTSQEIVNWGTKKALIDCMSTMVKEDSIWSRENRIFRNPSFMNEGIYLSELARLYSLRSK